MDGPTSREGKVQICLNKVWGAFCYRDNYYSYSVDANVICRELGYNNGNEPSLSYMYFVNFINKGNGMAYLAESPSADVLLITDMSCSQSATSVKQCSLTHYTKLSVCDARHTAAVRCHSMTNVCDVLILIIFLVRLY